MVVARGWGRGRSEELFNGDGVSVLQDESVLKMNDSDGCTIM